jgi:excinuclease UvrABC ATPase subunit
VTGRHVDHRAALKPSTRAHRGALEIRGASLHNLRDVDVDVPLGILTVVTGVAGSGKSSLIHGSLAGRDEVVVVDQTPIKGSRRSSPATYTGVLDEIRKLFAKQNGVKPALFSANSEGACPACKGLGVIITNLGFTQSVETRCELCEGSGFSDAVLEYTVEGRTIADVLAMSVEEAIAFCADAGLKGTAAATLARMSDVGLGYITLGQALGTLSGGERQRLNSPSRWPRRVPSTSSTNPRRACISPTSRVSSLFWTRWWMPATRSSRSNTTRRSWRTPTGSSTSDRARVAMAARSSSRARPRTSSRAAQL